MLKAIKKMDTIDELYYYEGNDLGNTYSKLQTSFKVWAPTADSVMLVVYDHWQDERGEEILMEKCEKGTWTVVLKGDKHGLFYTYKIKHGDSFEEAVDPYAKAVSVNGEKGAIVDMLLTNPNNWHNNVFTRPSNAVDSIIYELHVRDLSIHPESGIANKGKFLGLTEKNTKGSNGTTTGIDYIKELGVTHVQLLPIFDFGSVDETGVGHQFNWGYDPINYNCPEGSYSSNPYDPVVRIRELKKAIQVLHENKLGVIMDVVYNHMFDEKSSNFNKIVPGYYFRHNEDGSSADESACFNTIASERKMMRKFIVDSILYWAKEYKLDGFRFDLMGLLDVDTMNEVRAELNVIDNSIIILGEGWDMGDTLSKNNKAIQRNAYKMNNIAFFNDTIRDAVKGSALTLKETGFVNCNLKAKKLVVTGVVGAIKYSDTIDTWGHGVEPNQSVNYVEAHDNNTLWDKLTITNSLDSYEARKKMHWLSTAIIFTAQGIPFVHAGQEFLRTKNGEENSFKSSDIINRLDWVKKAENLDSVNYFKGLIELRKKHPALRMTSAAMIKMHLEFIDTSNSVVAFVIKNNANSDEWNQIVVIYNAARICEKVILPEDGSWKVVVNGEVAGVNPIETVNGNSVFVSELSAMVLYK